MLLFLAITSQDGLIVLHLRAVFSRLHQVQYGILGFGLVEYMCMFIGHLGSFSVPILLCDRLVALGAASGPILRRHADSQVQLQPQ
jgi:hypothetical protein